MKASPFQEQILHLVTLFLRKTAHEDVAQLLSSYYTLPAWVEHNNPIFKKGLSKIIKEYINSQPKLQHYYDNRSSNSDHQQSVEKSRPKRKSSIQKHKTANSPKAKLTNGFKHTKESPKHHPKTVSPKAHHAPWMSKFQQPKRLQDIQTHEQVKTTQQVDHPTTTKKTHSKKQKKQAIQSSDYESEQDSFELEPKKKHKREAKAEKVQIKHQQKAKQEIKKKPHAKVQEKQDIQQPVQNSKFVVTRNSNGPRQFFQRINSQDVGPIKEELKDNSFNAKAKFGQAADQWGQFGYDKLKDTRGDSFKKTKGRLKNRDFQGNLMDMNKINSIPIL